MLYCVKALTHISGPERKFEVSLTNSKALTHIIGPERKFKIPKFKFHLSTPASTSVSNKDNIGFTEDLRTFIRRSDLKRVSRMLFSPRW